MLDTRPEPASQLLDLMFAFGPKLKHPASNSTTKVLSREGSVSQTGTALDMVHSTFVTPVFDYD